ncbi:uncharacterized protein [Patagioenas fasciata]|uniref:uncharacterized protein n=1 Tax=Patagioenas fasciata TaxID=372321 RepID=UPI003A9A65B1
MEASAAAPTRIEVTIPIPLDMYQGSRVGEDNNELWDRGDREGVGVGPALGAERGPGVFAVGPAGAAAPSPSCTRAPVKEDASRREGDEDRDVDETSEQDLLSLVGQHVSPGPEVGLCPATAKETPKEYEFGEKKSKDVLRDIPREALLIETEPHKAGEDQEKSRQPLGEEENADVTPSEPSEIISQKEPEPADGEDSEPLLESARLPAEVKDGVEVRDAPLADAVPGTGERWMPKKKPCARVADRAVSRVPLLKGVCSVCPGLTLLAVCSRQGCLSHPPAC